MYFKDVITHLTSIVNLVDLCDKLKIDTKRTGERTSAICQFHNDTNPSMVLFDSDQQNGSSYHCFSCNAHGNIYELVKQVKGVEFKGAVQWLAKEYGISLTYPDNKMEVIKDDLLSQILEDVYQYALKQYKKNQNNNDLETYIKGRGYSKGIIEQADLCLTSQRNLLVYHLAKLKLIEAEKLIVFDEFEKCGLIKKSLFKVEEKTLYLPLEQDLKRSYYDHFGSERLLFPIQNENGIIRGFAGRTINEGNKGPKYLFTKGLKKADLLYRSHHAFKNIKKVKASDALIPLYLCEGLFDALRLESLGLNAVAILGADLSTNQTNLICGLARQLKNKALNVYLFFDNDNAGIKATANAIINLYKSSDPSSLELQVLHNVTDKKEDPDSYLKDETNPEDTYEKLEKIVYPLPAIYLASQMTVSTKLINQDTYWNDLPYSQRFRAAIEWNKIFDGTSRSVQATLQIFQSYQNEAWYKFLFFLNDTRDTPQENVHGNFLTETHSRVQHAIKLAQSSGLSSAFPNDIAEWRRLDMCSIALELIIEDRFNSLASDLRPIEPLNMIKASRKIADTEPRIMHMHCAEDLISHQYILNELLTESYDNSIINSSKTCKRLSDCIPVTRFYGQGNKSVTTGNGRQELILSFAYQINMDVLEGGPPKSEGMFRPYFHSWTDFTTSIASAANKMPLVHMVRLDLKRYYDQLKRHVVQDALRECLPEDIFSNEKFAPLIKGDKRRTRGFLINWLLEQSYGYDYYDPETGEVKTTDKLIGIPQGPDLSSFIANMVLFKIDNVAREFLDQQKNVNDDYSPAWYARYVDDMVIIADNAATLSLFRATLEDAVKKLELEIVAKEQPGAKTSEDFLKYLGKGKALSASGPTGVEPLIGLNDVKYIDKIERFQALGLLNDKSLYSDDSITIIKKVNMAANSEDLRLTDLTKISKWLWYAVTLKALDESTSPEQIQPTIIQNFIEEWRNVSLRFSVKLSPINCPWEDPLLIAIDGIKSTFENFDWINDELTNFQKTNKINIKNTLVRLVNSNKLIENLSLNKNREMIDGWAISKDKLKRTYWQKIVYLQWESRRLSTNKPIEYTNQNNRISANTDLAKSLIRLKFTAVEINNSKNIVIPEITNSTELYQICILLQEVYFYLGLDSESGLSSISTKINQFKRQLHENKKESETMELFSLLVSKGNN